jgi:hypothetical protein
MMGGDDLKKEIDKGIRGCKVSISCRLLWVPFLYYTILVVEGLEKMSISYIL